MEPWLDDLSDDLQSMSFNSSTIDIINRSTSSGSETTWTTSSSRVQSGDPCREAIHDAIHRSQSNQITLSDLHFIQRLGAGDIGSVFLAELKNGSAASNNPVFAAKVMDRKELEGRNKEGRARTEREILETLDHPFLPTLYATIESPKWICLLTDFCPGGDLHVLRQRQPAKHFLESAVRQMGNCLIEAMTTSSILTVDLDPSLSNGAK